MQINITATDKEKKGVIEAIMQLNEIRHIKSMSQKMIAECAEIKTTKVRVVLTDLVKEGAIEQYQVSDNKRVQRYYYVVTPLGKEYLDEK